MDLEKYFKGYRDRELYQTTGNSLPTFPTLGAKQAPLLSSANCLEKQASAQREPG